MLCNPYMPTNSILNELTIKCYLTLHRLLCIHILDDSVCKTRHVTFSYTLQGQSTATSTSILGPIRESERYIVTYYMHWEQAHLVVARNSKHCVHDLIIHEILRKKGKATQHNRKTKQCNTTRPRQRKNCLGWDSNPQPSAC